MDFQELNQIFTTDFNLEAVLAIRQNWRAGDKYSCLEIPRRRHGLILLLDCPAKYELPDGQMFQANPGDVMLLPLGARYSVTMLTPPGKTGHSFLINFRLTDTAGKRLSLGNQVVRLCQDSGKLQLLFSAAAELYKNAIPAALKAKVYSLFAALFPIAQTDECCIAYINQHYTDRFHIPKLAQMCAMSETAYRKRFRAITGMSPIQYINHLKIKKACQMLRSGDMRPEDICDFLNFYSLPYFYKVFRDYMGCTPNEYRNQRL